MLLLATALAAVPPGTVARVPLAPVLDACAPAPSGEALVCTGMRSDGLHVVVRGPERAPLASGVLDLPGIVGDAVVDIDGVVWMLVDRPRERIVAWNPTSGALTERWMVGMQELALRPVDSAGGVVAVGKDRGFQPFLLPLVEDRFANGPLVRLDCPLIDGDDAALLCGGARASLVAPDPSADRLGLESPFDGGEAVRGALSPSWVALLFVDPETGRRRIVARQRKGERRVEHPGGVGDGGFCLNGNVLMFGTVTAGGGAVGFLRLGEEAEVVRVDVGGDRAPTFTCGKYGALLHHDGRFRPVTPDGVQPSWGWRLPLSGVERAAGGLQVRVDDGHVLRRSGALRPEVASAGVDRKERPVHDLDRWDDEATFPDGGGLRVESRALVRFDDEGSTVWTRGFPVGTEVRFVRVEERLLVVLRGVQEGTARSWQSLWSVDFASGELHGSRRIRTDAGPDTAVLVLSEGVLTAGSDGLTTRYDLDLEELGSRATHPKGAEVVLLRLADGPTLVWRTDDELVAETWPTPLP